MARTIEKGSNLAYQGLAMMSQLFYEKLGKEAIPIIKKVWYEMGLASGKKLKGRKSTHDFKSAAIIICERTKRNGAIGTYEISDELYHITSDIGYKCDVGLEDAGCDICEAVMSINQGQFKSICDCDVEMNIVRSRAASDDCCEITFRPINSPEKE